MDEKDADDLALLLADHYHDMRALRVAWVNPR